VIVDPSTAAPEAVKKETRTKTSTNFFFDKALFSFQKILQNFSDSPSHRIFGHMHEVLNIDKK
jgi:hypothetical protein